MGYLSPVFKQVGFLFSGLCEHGNEFHGFIKKREFLDQLNWHKLVNTKFSFEVFGRILCSKRGVQNPRRHVALETRLYLVAPHLFGPQYEACYVSSFWRFEFGSGH